MNSISNNRCYIGGIIASSAAIVTLTTISALFFMHVIPLSSNPTALLAGTTLVSANTIPILIGLFLLYRCSRSRGEGKRLSSVDEPNSPLPIEIEKSQESEPKTWEALLTHIAIGHHKSLLYNSYKKQLLVFTIQVEIKYDPNDSQISENLIQAVHHVIQTVHTHIGPGCVFSLELMVESDSDKETVYGTFYPSLKQIGDDEKGVIQISGAYKHSDGSEYRDYFGYEDYHRENMANFNDTLEIRKLHCLNNLPKDWDPDAANKKFDEISKNKRSISHCEEGKFVQSKHYKQNVPFNQLKFSD